MYSESISILKLDLHYACNCLASVLLRLKRKYTDHMFSTNLIIFHEYRHNSFTAIKILINLSRFRKQFQCVYKKRSVYWTGSPLIRLLFDFPIIIVNLKKKSRSFSFSPNQTTSETNQRSVHSSVFHIAYDMNVKTTDI